MTNSNLITQGEAKSLLKDDFLFAFEDYKFKTTPMLHQFASMAWAMHRDEVMYFHDIGTGKTLTAMYTCQLWDVKRVLVVCPTAVMSTWEEQLAEHTDCTYAVLYGERNFRRAIVRDDTSMYHIINYEGLKSVWADKQEVIEKVKGKAQKVNKFLPDKDAIFRSDYDCIVMDEHHRCKDWESLQTKVLYELSLLANKIIMMSGTPIAKDVRDFWAEMMVLDNGETLGNDQFVFLHTYMNPVTYGKGRKAFKDWVPKKGANDEILELMSPKAMRYDIQECCDLPPLTYEKRYVLLSPDQCKATDAVIDGWKLELDDGELTIEDVQNKASKLAQIASGFYYHYDKEGNKKTYTFKTIPKIEELIKLLQTEINGKVIVFHKFIETAHIIEARLKKAKIKYRSIRGEITDKKKQINDFKNKPDVKVLLAHPKTGGEGLNLQCSHTIIFIEQIHEGATLRKQCVGRIWRNGQEERCLIIDIMCQHPKLASRSIDDHIAESAKTKKDLAEYLLDWVRDLK